MRIILFLIIFLLTGVAHAQSVRTEVVVVSKAGFPPHEMIRQTFERELFRLVPATCAKSIESCLHVHKVSVGQGDSAQAVAAMIRSLQPNLILALGPEALGAAAHFLHVPVLSLLVINPEEIIANHANMIAIKLSIPVKVQLDEVTRLLPQTKRVGVIFDPIRSRETIAEARASRPDLEFVTRAAGSAREVSALLKQLPGRIDLLWMLPDLTVTNVNTINDYLQFSFNYKVPLLVFSKKYLKLGATVAVTFDLDSMGKEAARLGALLLTGIAPADLHPRQATGFKTVINENILHKMNIPFVGKEN